jgi:hypothetical protein
MCSEWCDILINEGEVIKKIVIVERITIFNSFSPVFYSNSIMCYINVFSRYGISVYYIFTNEKKIPQAVTGIIIPEKTMM